MYSPEANKKTKDNGGSFSVIENKKTAHYKLIGTEISYYTGKLRSYLRYKEIPFEEVQCSPEMYKQVIIPKTGVNYIPVLLTPENEALQDTCVIMDYLEAKYPIPNVYPLTPVQKLVSHLFELYADEWLVIPAMHYRWNFPEQLRYVHYEFGSNSTSAEDRSKYEAIGEQLSTRFSSTLPFLGISESTKEAIEQTYLEFLNYFNEHLKYYPYLLGNRPCLGDFALMGPLYAHLYRDPVPGLIMKTKAPYVADWVERMNGGLLSRTHQHYYDSATGHVVRIVSNSLTEFLPDDQIPSTLLPMISMIFREQFPLIMSTLEHVSQFVKNGHPLDKPIPKGIGSHTFQIGGRSGSRYIFPFVIWKAQRVINELGSKGSPERATQETLLQSIPNALEYLTSTKWNEFKLERKDNQLYVKLASKL